MEEVLDNSCTRFIPKLFLEFLANILSMHIFLSCRDWGANESDTDR